jgi:NhaP-type Na+/H+ or K+/H+ antiporter
VAVAAGSERLGLAAPLSFVVIGGALGFVPGVPSVVFDPDWVLVGVLPPLLYASSVVMPANDFRRSFRAIFWLAVPLVLLTTLAAAWLLHGLVDGLSWSASFAVGAVISPTDPVAATSVGRRLGLPARLLTVLEGEGLVNDASALVLLRSAISAMAASVSLWGIAGKFVASVLAAIAIGLVVGVVGIRIRHRLADAVLNSAVSLVLPFVAYLTAEEIDASGVLAVVVTGLVSGHLAPRNLRAADRITERANWRTIAFLLESGIFLFMGLELRPLADRIHDPHFSPARCLSLGLFLALLVIVLRIAFTMPMVAGLRRDERARVAAARPLLDAQRAWLADNEVEPGLQKRRHRWERRIDRAHADLRYLTEQDFGWRGGAVLAWSGMRGAITVAAVQTLPAGTPYRDQLVLTAFVVAASTLLMQGSTLPAVIKALRVPGDDPAKFRDEYSTLLHELSDSGLAALDAAQAAAEAKDPSGKGFDPLIRARVRNDSLIREEEEAEESPDPYYKTAREDYRRLRAGVLEKQKQTLEADRSVGSYSSAVLDRAQKLLDREELTVRQLDSGVDPRGRRAGGSATS